MFLGYSDILIRFSDEPSISDVSMIGDLYLSELYKSFTCTITTCKKP